MSEAEFARVAGQARGRARRLCLHVKGDPLLHPLLPRFLDIAAGEGLAVHLTSAGPGLPELLPRLLGRPALRRINLSLQALAGLPDRDARLAALLPAARRAGAEIPVALRLWNRGGAGYPELLAAVADAFGRGAAELAAELERSGGAMLAPGVGLHAAPRFDWPDPAGAAQGGPAWCLGLRDQAAVLADGTAVPCCLDGAGIVDLGNLFYQDWDAAFDGPRARALREGFARGEAAEELCRRCGFRSRFAAKAAAAASRAGRPSLGGRALGRIADGDVD